MHASTTLFSADPLPRPRLPAARARPLLVSGIVMLALVPLLFATMLLDGRTLDGGHVGAESVWLKPLKFHLATGVHLVTVGLCTAAFAAARRSDRTMRVLVVLLIGCSVFEVGYITLRGALGLRSHFATDAVGAMAYNLMGVASVVIVVVTAITGLRILRERPTGTAPHLHLAAGLGLVVSGVTGLVSGVTIGVAGGPLIGPAADGGALPLFGWSLVAGDLRVSHFLGLHAAQALPLAAILLGPRGPTEGRLAVVVCAALLCVAIAAAYAGALAGRSFLAL